ncbi:hypothetical protein Tco_0682445 [Tanacetum coccineum]|uniref:Uncharacterized protein n=1 Tax=Tanacetum coccineum TaxID=301880 RepID=A0ABQ4XS84_9ASTR
MEEINNFQQEPDENLYQACERFKELLMKCPQHYLTEMQEVILFYNGLRIPTRQILDSRGVIPSKTVVDAKVAIQKMAKYSQKWHNGTYRSRSTKTSDGLAAIQAQLNNLGREIKKVNEKVYVDQVGRKQCKGPHYTKDFLLKKEGKTLEEAYYTQFGRPFQGDNLKPTIKEREVLEEFRTRDDELDTGIDDYPSYCDYDKKTHIDSRWLYKGNNAIGALMNVPIFVGTFYVVVDFAVLEDMDAYRDEGMGDIIFGEPFLREVEIKARRFEGMITVYNGNESVTYQMVQSHPRFKNHTNEQCNKILPLLKESDEDKKNVISHPY